MDPSPLVTKGDVGLHGLGMMVCVRFRGFVFRDLSAALPVRGSAVFAKFIASGIYVIELPLLAPQHFRCAEVLFLAETHEFLDSEIITVGAKRFRYAAVLFQPYFQPDVYIRKILYANIVAGHRHPQERVRPCRVDLASIASVTRECCCSPASQRNPMEYDDYVRKNVYVNVVLSILLTASDTSVTRRCCPARWLLPSQ